ncbi:hypothetical protein [Mycolicibacterium fortuitum]|uniref:Transmembrane protein n=2 Tax=Mycolicibacterium fortuitum TaxID=1766 RepID=A0AAE4VHP0_MYCFO|nr:hypothetical protein [Mycolicibacterium fortuitum]MCV7137897.1 hypothetical protein [Mycolicibacterium fortuitum]MDV7195389.1 hypothetical protein [Mycolicibacterium fortuitum]MDV7207915.1 hypothetical protein [Mycolicibacterium fortuitum]MDV7229213.1 hypothetical protein [Mycolicibacterium fortuitum]MDV7260912.1 hypothetical protein [Mycolicibacterium fortuitum]
MTPHQIATLLTPWVLGLLTFALLLIGGKRMLAISGRVGALFAGRYSITAKDTAHAAFIGLAGIALFREINRLSPDPQWWAQPLNSGWEISSATMGVLVLAVEPLLGLLAVWAFAVGALFVTVWLCEPTDVDYPNSPTRWQQIGNLARGIGHLYREIWEAYRPRRTHTTRSEGRA